MGTRCRLFPPAAFVRFYLLNFSSNSTFKMSSQVQALQKQVGQLRQEAGVQRIMVSEAIKEMVTFMTENSPTDGLVSGITQADNPFRDQKSCTII